MLHDDCFWDRGVDIASCDLGTLTHPRDWGEFPLLVTAQRRHSHALRDEDILVVTGSDASLGVVAGNRL